MNITINDSACGKSVEFIFIFIYTHTYVYDIDIDIYIYNTLVPKCANTSLLSQPKMCK